jgi:hypothetical protein
MNNTCKKYIESAINTYGYNEVFEQCMVNENFKGAIIGLALMGTLGYGMYKSCMKSDQFTPEEKERIETIYNKDEITETDIPDFDSKVEAVTKYMEDMMKLRYGHRKTSNGTPKWKIEYDKITLSPEYLVLTCAKYKYDLPLLLATANVESIFGTSARCHSGTNGNPATHSVFSVGSVDSGANRNYYKNDNDSVVPYIKLMLNNYLVDKTVDDVLKPGKLVNADGNRYATDTKYENTLKYHRNKIIKNYPELEDTMESTWNLNTDFSDTYTDLI